MRWVILLFVLSICLQCLQPNRFLTCLKKVRESTDRQTKADTKISQLTSM